MCAMITLANPATNSNRQQTYFNRKLLKTLVHSLRLAQFAAPGELAKHAGSKTVRYFRRKEADETNVLSLTEGTAPSTYAEFELEHVDCQLAQFGEIMKISDLQNDLDIFKSVDQAIDQMGEDAALKADSVIRNAIMAGLADTDGSGAERFSGTPGTGDSATDFGTFHALTAANGKATRAHFLACATQLKSNNALKINGSYVAMVAPEIEFDLRQDSSIETAFTRAGGEKFFKDELGTVDGVRFVSHTNAFREGATYKTYSATGANFTSLVFGREAFGAPKLEGENSPWMPKIRVLKDADKSDPLNQYVLAGWKVFWNAVLLHEKAIVALRSKSTFA